MTKEEAIVWCNRFNSAWANADPDGDFPDIKYSDTLDQLFCLAGNALRAQQAAEAECAKCSGIMYRQTDSGKIIPISQRCGVKNTPPCYVPDGDGCAYQIYGDNDDEPIDRCKSCPLCQSDKIRHQTALKKNEPLTLDELREMDEAKEPVYLYIFRSDIDSGWQIIKQITDRKIIFRGSMGIYVPIKELGISYNLYRRKPKEETI